MPGVENKTKHVLNLKEPQTVKKLILHKDVYCLYHESGVTRRKWACQLELMSFNVSQVEVESRLLIDTWLLLDVVILKWSDFVLCEEESGFPHKETYPVMFSRVYTRGPENHLATKMVLKSLMRSRCSCTFKSLAHFSRGPSRDCERGQIDTKLDISCH